MADEKAIQRRTRGPNKPRETMIDRLTALLAEMDDETLYGAQYVCQGFCADRFRNRKPAEKADPQAMLELGAVSAKGGE